MKVVRRTQQRTCYLTGWGDDQSGLDTNDEANINIPNSKAPQGEQVMDKEVEAQEQEVMVLRTSNRGIFSENITASIYTIL